MFVFDQHLLLWGHLKCFIIILYHQKKDNHKITINQIRDSSACLRLRLLSLAHCDQRMLLLIEATCSFFDDTVSAHGLRTTDLEQ